MVETKPSIPLHKIKSRRLCVKPNVRMCVRACLKLSVFSSVLLHQAPAMGSVLALRILGGSNVASVLERKINK